MLNNLRFINLDIRGYFSDILILIIVGIASNKLIEFLYFGGRIESYLFEGIHHIFPNYDLFPLSLEIFKLLFWIVLFLLIKWLWIEFITFLSLKCPDDYGFNYFLTSNSKKRKDPLTAEKLSQDYIFQGNIKPSRNGLIITNTHSGCLVKAKPRLFPCRRVWKNFIADLEIVFITQKNMTNKHTYWSSKESPKKQKETVSEEFKPYLGIVFRARNFDDYFMLELVKVDRNLIIRPHVRIAAGWDAPILNPDYNVSSAVFSNKSEEIKLTT